jgi:hypothetical protein
MSAWGNLLVEWMACMVFRYDTERIAAPQMVFRLSREDPAVLGERAPGQKAAG